MIRKIVFTMMLLAGFVLAQDSFAVSSRHDRHDRHDRSRDDSRDGHSKERSRPNKMEQIKKETEEFNDSVEESLKTFLEAFEAGTVVSADQLDDIENQSRQGRRLMRYMSKKEKAKASLMQAWVSYSKGDLAIAAREAAKAYSLDSKNPDAYESQIVFNLLQFKAPKPKMRSRVKDKHDSHKASESAIKTHFPEGAERLIGKKITAADEAHSDKFSAVLFWRLPEQGDYKAIEKLILRAFDDEEKDKLKEELSKKQQANQDVVHEELSRILKFAMDNTLPQKVSFIAINTNSEDGFENARSFMTENGFDKINLNQEPLEVSDNKDLAQLVKGDLRAVALLMEPVLVIVSPEGEIKYAGSARGQLPSMVIESLVPGALKVEEVKEVIGKPVRMLPVMPDGTVVTDSNSIPESKEQKESAEPATKKPAKELTEEEKMQAEQLLQKARMFRQSHTRLGVSRKVVKACREIIEKYPDTTYEEQAKEILRSIPAHQRARYGIKEEELE